MRKHITKEQIVATALELLKDKNDIGCVNLREIARTIGCAHTNIYNYFRSFDELLWELRITIEKNFITELSQQLSHIQEDEVKLNRFFYTIAKMYLDNKGWFGLLWIHYIDGVRPDKDIVATKQTVGQMLDFLREIWLGIHHVAVDQALIFRVLHNVHCYIVGEVSNYIHDRRLVHDAEELKTYIADTSVSIFTLCLTRGNGAANR